jgi:hypothetical protein
MSRFSMWFLSGLIVLKEFALAVLAKIAQHLLHFALKVGLPLVALMAL